MKIGLLQCDHVVEALQPQHGDVPDLFKNLFNRVAPEVLLDVFNVTKGEYPNLTKGYDGFISSGADAGGWIRSIASSTLRRNLWW